LLFSNQRDFVLFNMILPIFWLLTRSKIVFTRGKIVLTCEQQRQITKLRKTRVQLQWQCRGKNTNASSINYHPRPLNHDLWMDHSNNCKPANLSIKLTFMGRLARISAPILSPASLHWACRLGPVWISGIIVCPPTFSSKLTLSIQTGRIILG